MDRRVGAVRRAEEESAGGEFVGVLLEQRFGGVRGALADREQARQADRPAVCVPDQVEGGDVVGGPALGHPVCPPRVEAAGEGPLAHQPTDVVGIPCSRGTELRGALRRREQFLPQQRIAGQEDSLFDQFGALNRILGVLQQRDPVSGGPGAGGLVVARLPPPVGEFDHVAVRLVERQPQPPTGDDAQVRERREEFGPTGQQLLVGFPDSGEQPEDMMPASAGEFPGEPFDDLGGEVVRHRPGRGCRSPGPQRPVHGLREQRQAACQAYGELASLDALVPLPGSGSGSDHEVVVGQGRDRHGDGVRGPLVQAAVERAAAHHQQPSGGAQRLAHGLSSAGPVRAVEHQ
ncbi:hypothetical protein GPJ59_07870 [Streptomyces bambusae]|uniref:Uncharacterized protein n=1 Tax=Streptomyces bambusae TaxID=1550616 RepID=A0ABS6Z3I7_9ACTN|nr:hypothetical protein [Streptomyces bambusae]